MRPLLEHFAFLVFLSAYISHYIANAEIRIYPALLVSVMRTNFQTHQCVSQLTLVAAQFVFAASEHLRAS